MIDEKLNEHTPEFEHFKLHADSTLKMYTKESLIRYIHMLYDNWSATDIWTARLLNVSNELNKSLEELVDKDTPKKILDKKEELHGMSFICPNCGKKIYTNFIRNYCGECGQRLEWGKVK